MNTTVQSRLSDVRIIHLLLVATAVFFPFIFLPPPYLFLVTNALIFTASVVNVVVFWPAAKVSMSKSISETKYVDLLTTGIFKIFVALTLILGYTIILQFMGELPLVNTRTYESTFYYLPQSFFRWFGLLGAFLHLGARPMLGGSTPSRKNGTHIMWVIASGLVLSSVQVVVLM